MATYWSCVVHIPKTTGIPADEVQNTFNFVVDDTAGAEVLADSVELVLHNFYNELTGDQTQPIQHWLSETMARGTPPGRIDIYDVSNFSQGEPHGPPIFTRPFSLEGSGGNALPAEMACVLSYHATYENVTEFGPGDTRPRARNRGRLYLGQLSVEVMSGAAEVFISEDVRQDITQAAIGLAAADEFLVWSVWSRVDGNMRPVVGGWVDDAFDVQRRRGVEAQARTTFVIS